MKLILLRPSQGAQQSAIIARQMGFDPIIAPASQIAPLPWDAPPAQNFDAIMITSANALRMAHLSKPEIIAQYKHLPLFAVGKATAKLAQDMGFTIAAMGQGGAKALWPHIISHGAKNILRLVGRDYVAVDNDVNICTIMVYEARALPINDTLKSLIMSATGPHIFAFHSAKAVHIFDTYLAQMQNIIFDKSAHYAVALAPTIAHEISPDWRDTIISPSASDADMMQRLSEKLGG